MPPYSRSPGECPRPSSRAALCVSHHQRRRRCMARTCRCRRSKGPSSRCSSRRWAPSGSLSSALSRRVEGRPVTPSLVNLVAPFLVLPTPPSGGRIAAPPHPAAVPLHRSVGITTGVLIDCDGPRAAAPRQSGHVRQEPEGDGHGKGILGSRGGGEQGASGCRYQGGVTAGTGGGLVPYLRS